MKNSFVIIDGYGFIFRAYHVLPPLTSPDGKPVGALFGFTSMLMKTLLDFAPEQIIIALDHAGKNFRHNLYDQYKANRPAIEQDLISQLKLLPDIAKALDIQTLAVEGYEADDIIATIATKADQMAKEAIIISSDKDLMQLTSQHIRMYDPVKNKFIGATEIEKKFATSADKVREVQALIGDKSDNIPGVPGIGPKTAAKLIEQFGSLAAIYNNIAEVKNDRQRRLLQENEHQAKLSWQLVGLDSSVPLGFELGDIGKPKPSAQQLSAFLRQYGFNSLMKRVASLFALEISQPPQRAEPANRQNSEIINIIIEDANSNKASDLIELSATNGYLAILLNEDSQNIILYGGGEAIFTASLQVLQQENSQLLKHLTNQSIKKITYDQKSLQKLLGYQLPATEDIALMQYSISAGKPQQDIKALYYQLFNKEASSGLELCKKLPDIHPRMQAHLQQEKALHLYYNLDQPLSGVLFEMEQTGIQIDTTILQQLSDDFAAKMLKLEQKIYTLAGEEFNVASSKQLGEILFDKLTLPGGKRSAKSKSYSTSADILEKLSAMGHDIARYILEYRHYSKLKSTYTDSLIKQIDPQSRIHTTFLQNSTSTGRLSSRDPNLQNIPIRTADGKLIRQCFVAGKGNKLISADYSQIELRLLAHIANVKKLQESFNNNEDIHAATAREVFDLEPMAAVNAELRRRAKAINFGIIYGISAFGLAKQLDIPQADAAKYIEKYFKKYPEIAAYMAETKQQARDKGYVTTLLGRRCYLPDINSGNFLVRSFAERAAINAPLQGSNADIIKLAMINLSKQLASSKFSTKMLLQIHDELLFEAPEDELLQVTTLIKNSMASALEAGPKMVVDIKIADSWGS